MKRETLIYLADLRDTLQRDRDGCLEPGYSGTNADEVNRRLDELVAILIKDAEDDE